MFFFLVYKVIRLVYFIWQTSENGIFAGTEIYRFWMAHMRVVGWETAHRGGVWYIFLHNWRMKRRKGAQSVPMDRRGQGDVF